MMELPSLDISVGMTLAGLIFTYMMFKLYQFQRPAEIRESVQQGFKDYRIHEDAGLMYRATRVLAEKPGFPERLYKYFPKIKREGFVEIEFTIEPFPEEESIVLPKTSEIRTYNLFPAEVAEIRQAKWSNSPIKNTSIILRIYAFNDREVINLASAAMASMVEVTTGEIDREFHAQFKHAEIDDTI
jgi:hypothetical protein